MLRNPGLCPLGRLAKGAKRLRQIPGNLNEQEPTMIEHKVPGVVKVIELVGSSPNSWSDAAKVAVQRASKTLKNIVGVDVLHSTAVVEGGEITEYRVNLKVAFVIEDES
jgi:flavin-binding protein dodecin